MNHFPALHSAELILVRLPMVSPFTTSFGTTSVKEALLVRLNAGDFTGWGECVTLPDPSYSAETNDSARNIIRKYLLPLLVERNDWSTDDVFTRLQRVRGNRMAQAGLENALLDLRAKVMGIPLYEYLGGIPKPVKSGISIGIQTSIDRLLSTVEQAQAKKYHRIKLKIDRGQDIKILDAVRASFPGLPLMVDANAAYAMADLALFQRMDDYNLMMIEQPLAEEDLVEHAQLQQHLRTPICLDESIECPAQAEAALALGSCRIINIKQGRVGGLLAARKIQELCLKNEVPVWSGGMLETGIGRAANIHLQTLPGFVLPGDTSETSRYFREDIVKPVVTLDENGYITVPGGPGIGVQVIPENLKKVMVRAESIAF